MSGRTTPRRAVTQATYELGRPLVALAEVYRARVTLNKRSAASGTGAVLSHIPHPSDAASLVASAREAFLRGDSAACASMLEGHTFTDASLRTEALFLSARALMRLQRSRDVVKLLEPSLGTFSALDESCTARMLHGYAVAFAQDVDRGLQLLAATAIFADSEHVHRSIRAELSYYRGFAHWVKCEYSEASRYAIEAEDAHLDVLSVRATELRAFIASAEANYAEALQLFKRARQAYATCQGRDVGLATTIVYQIALLEMNLRSAAICGSHKDVNGRTIPGTPFGPAVATPNRMLLASADAWLYALDGNRVEAVRKSLEAISFAPDSSWRVLALSSGATLSQALGESAHARCLADEAGKIAITIDWNATADEQRLGLLRLAEACAALNPPAAPTLLDRYDGLTSKIDRGRLTHDTGLDPRHAGWDAYVRGLVARVVGDHERAADRFRNAVKLFTSCGYLWRAALALIELDATPVDTTAESPLEKAAVIIRDNFPESFLAARLGWARLYMDPTGRTLTPSQVDILCRMLENKSVNAIANETGRAVRTVRKHIEAVQEAFGTHSIAELVLECVRRGIVPMTAPSEPTALPRIS
jgi:DNA-binding CsgD family transcriptional regulator/tetratricopeptide (TPR) repeat protein